MSSAIKGGKKKRRGKNQHTISKPYISPEEGQFIAKAIKPLGSFKVQLEVFFYEHKKNKDGKIINTSFNKEIVIGNIRGSMRRRQYVNPGDIVLVSKRDFNIDNRIVDIIVLYKPYHYSNLKNSKFVPKEFNFDKSTSKDKDNDNIKFDYSDSEEDNSISNEDIEFQKELKSKKRREVANTQDYMANIMPEMEEYTEEQLSRDIDEFGNYI